MGRHRQLMAMLAAARVVCVWVCLDRFGRSRGVDPDHWKIVEYNWTLRAKLSRSSRPEDISTGPVLDPEARTGQVLYTRESIVSHIVNKRVKVRVTGRVQGVYYRASTREKAASLGLSGWVRNTFDGAVELEAQGPPDAVDALVAWCHEGPPAARVREVAVEATALRDDDDGFDVRH